MLSMQAESKCKLFNVIQCIYTQKNAEAGDVNSLSTFAFSSCPSYAPGGVAGNVEDEICSAVLQCHIFRAVTPRLRPTVPQTFKENLSNK